MGPYHILTLAYVSNLKKKVLFPQNSILKIVSAIFYQIFVFPPNDSHSITLKSVFFPHQKSLFIVEIFKLLSFFHFLSTLSRYKRTNRSGIICDVIIGLHKFADVIFGITQQPFYIISLTLVR